MKRLLAWLRRAATEPAASAIYAADAPCLSDCTNALHNH